MTVPFRVIAETDGDRIALIARGDVRLAASYLRVLSPAFRATKSQGGLQCPLTWGAVVQLSAQLGDAWEPGPALRAWSTAEFRRRIDEPPPLKVTTPGGTPMAHQITGARLIAAAGGRAMLFDDPGTGKTLTALLGFLECRERGVVGPGPLIVVCPNSVVTNWTREIERWTELQPVAWRGPSVKRRALTGYDVYVVGYSLLQRDGAVLASRKPAGLIIDECHWIKNTHTARSVAARKLAPRDGAVIALSGTPITHGAGGLWPTLNAVTPRLWSSRERYVHRYVRTVPGDYGETELGLDPHYEPEFRDVLRGSYRRVAKTAVLELPPKVYTAREIELPADARRVYDQMEGLMLAELANGEELTAMGTLAQLTRLNQLACASADVTTELETANDGTERERVHVVLRAPSWKIDAALDVLAERPGRQTVLAAPSRQLVALALTAAREAGYRVGEVVGGQTPIERDAAVDAFQAGQLDVLGVTTAAGGVGLTLTAADTVVFLQRPWSYVEASQMEDRCHRKGSERHRSVEIIDIVASRTIDARIREVLRGKAHSLAELLEDPSIAQLCLGGQENMT